jgi:4-carboxymuconolactone decarboxylase
MSPATRIEPVAEPLTPMIAERMAKIFPPGLPLPQLYLTMARNEPLFVHIVDIGLIGPTGLLDRRSLVKILRETIILRTCVAARNDYEFNLHAQTISERMGLTQQQIEDVRSPQPTAALWPDDIFAAMTLVDGLVQRIEVLDEVYAKARAHFDEPMLIEITQIVGLYTGVAMLVALARPRFDRYHSGPPVLARLDAAP